MNRFDILEALLDLVEKDVAQIERDAGTLQRITGEPYGTCLDRINAMRFETTLQRIANQFAQVED